MLTDATFEAVAVGDGEGEGEEDGADGELDPPPPQPQTVTMTAMTPYPAIDTRRMLASLLQRSITRRRQQGACQPKDSDLQSSARKALRRV
jgi:hypothetical protein